MNTTKSFLLAGAAVVLLLMSSCGSKKGSDSNAQTAADSVKQIKTVKLLTLSKTEVMRNLEYTASISPYEELYMAPAQPGRITKINVEIGDRVSKGQIIAEMDKTTLNQAELQLINLEKDYKRLDTLMQVGGVAAQQYDQIKTQLNVTRNNVEFLRDNVVLKSPFTGIITAKYFENGELYSGAPNTQVGKAALVIIQQINPLKATIAISEKYYPIVKTGMEAVLTCDIYPGEIFKGKISLIHPTINAMSRTFNVEVQIPNGNEKLRPGMFAKVNVSVGKEEAMVVPVTSVLVQEGTNIRYVFVYIDGKAKRVNVETGKRFDDKIEIFSDNLKEGDKIIVAGQNKLLEGDVVTVVE
ncbi:MAG: efflux RND transporter periplasmic adaptor subunit [Bacteroidales bacterium]|nr:efflux RND transporter periplasmic adaptor subunit [Bacteroidales bacterium]HOY39431.1 efflux RND transporter periplasmic adaptor subunit [Bacteroidales bacterium]HQL69416.1 efflux RND transporter periplasmic adaptor subunit [Bacteroidales bacterium]